MLKVRNGVMEDLTRIMEIYRYAQDFMIAAGNPTQWAHTYPTQELIESDMEKGVCKVIYDEDGIHGVFALFAGADPTYAHIEGRGWLNDEPYVTIHRLAGDGVTHGMFATALEYSKSECDNVRVDTHADNAPMQKLADKAGFTRCGTIYVADGSPRVAFHWSAK